MRVLSRTAVTRTGAVVAAVAALTASVTVGSSTAGASGSGSGASEQALDVVGLAGKGTRLISFSTDEPGKRRAIGRITGLSGGDTRLVGIDFRVQDGKLYGVGDEGGVYRFDRGPRATRLSNPALPLDDSTSFGVDVNPAANALRVISAQGQNLRLPLAVEGAAAVVDAPLTRPVVPATTPPSSEPALGLTGAAYTNNDLDPTTATTLFDLDTARNQVTLQSPANSGLTAATGDLGFDAAPDTGFDIYSRVSGGKTVELRPYAVSGGVLYDVDLLTGAASAVGELSDLTTSDLAIPLGQL